MIDGWLAHVARGVGHTQAAVESFALVIVNNQTEAAEVERRGGEAITLQDARDRGLMGKHAGRALVFDTSTVARMVQEAEDKRLTDLSRERAAWAGTVKNQRAELVTESAARRATRKKLILSQREIELRQAWDAQVRAAVEAIYKQGKGHHVEATRALLDAWPSFEVDAEAAL